MEQKLNNILNTFSPITLCEMDSVEFMNRVDSKYVFHASLIPTLLNEASTHYQVLEIDQKRLFNYNTTYFDTELHDMYNMHIQGKLNRQKLRMRIYEITGTSFLEIKVNTNKGRTIKERIKTWDSAGTVIETDDFIKTKLPFPIDSLKPAITNHFKRITLVSVKSRERLTLDFDLGFEDTAGNRKNLLHIGIAELKRDSRSGNSRIIDILRSQHIHSMAFSKYCIGSALLNADFKRNILKPQLLLIEKLQKQIL